MDYPLKVFYDGSCIVCATEIGHYRRLEKKGRLTFVDIAAPGFDAAAFGLEQSEVMAKMHVMDAAGVVYVGVNAFERIWEVLPGVRFRLLGGVLRLPLARPVCRAGYRLFARYRHLLPKRGCHDGGCDI